MTDQDFTDLRARHACALLGWHFLGDGSSDQYHVTRHGDGDTFALHDREGAETRATVEGLEFAATLRGAGIVDIGGRAVSASAAAVLALSGPPVWRIDILNPVDGEWRVSGDGLFGSPFYASDNTAEEIAAGLAEREQLENLSLIDAYRVHVTAPLQGCARVVKICIRGGHEGACKALRSALIRSIESSLDQQGRGASS